MPQSRKEHATYFSQCMEQQIIVHYDKWFWQCPINSNVLIGGSIL